MQISISLRVALLVLHVPTFGYAQDILTVTTSEVSESFTLEDLLAMPQTTIVTKNDYVDEASAFQGPSLRSILEEMDITSDATLRVGALNDYSALVPAVDAFDYEVILAVLRDGDTMSVREKGPIWVIYPMDSYLDLQNDVYNDRLVWQLKSISVE